MRRRGGASGLPIKGRRRSTIRPKAHKAPTVNPPTSDLQDQLDRRTRERDQALEQQTATAEILSVISNSLTDTQPVFDAIVQSGLKLFPNATISVALRDGDMVNVAAIAESDPARAEAWRRRFPNPLTREYMHGTAILDRRIVDIADVRGVLGEFAAGSRNFLASGYLAITIMPMMRGSEAIGAFSVVRLAPGPLSGKQLAVLRTFAAQAVIAIENTRLLNEIRESLQQQTATADVLKVISRSTFDLQTVLDTLVESAVRLCDAESAHIFRRTETGFELAACRGYSREYEERARRRRFAPGRDSLVGRIALEGRMVHIADVLADAEYNQLESQTLGRWRTMLGVPLLREGTLIGALTLTRSVVRPFTDKQIQLITTYADQAVIAIENVRLFDDVQKRTQELSEALEQQTAMSEVLRVISSSSTELAPVFDTILANATRLCEGNFAALWQYDGEALVGVAQHNLSPGFAELCRNTKLWPGPEGAIRKAALERRTIHVADITAESGFSPVVLQYEKARTVLAVPLLRENDLVGIVGIWRREVEPFTEQQIALVRTFADQAVIAIENSRLLNELRQSLQQQTATADVLKAISRSTFDLQVVLDTLVESAARLCKAERGIVFRREGETYKSIAHFNYSREFREFHESHPIAPGRGTAVGRTALEGKTVHIPDVLADPEYTFIAAQKLGQYRANLAVPLLREGNPIGALSLTRSEPLPFSAKQIELVETFADQAVIAIENARLFEEVQSRTRELSQSVDELRALGEVSQAVNSTLDLETVLTTIVGRAVQLSRTDAGAIYVFDEERKEFRLHATYGMSEAMIAAISDRHIGLGDANIGAAAAQRKPIQVPDIRNEPASPVNEIILREGYRSILIIPLLRPDHIVGALIVRRKVPGEFPQSTIELLKTFADQSVVAIQNAKLFESVEARTRELAKSLEDLRTAQDRLVQTEKLASLGQLTAGIAHEIKNPLNFVNNFSAISVELIDELQETMQGMQIDEKRRAEINERTDMLRGNLDKVVQHGKRADAIVKNMLLHSRQSSGEHRPIDINALVEESLNLAYHGARAEKQGFNITLERSFDPTAGEVDVFPQEITRVLLNLISNGFYAATKRKAEANGANYEPTLAAATKNLGDSVEIRIRDNGTGIPPEVKEKMFNPFFTTKPVGEGTGLGLSISHDIIVKQHGGSIEVDTQPGEFTEFRIVLPRAAASIAKSGERP
jgi:two-component system, NtrC family, sensor kinase